MTWNVNGLRAAIRKGFQSHLDRICPDVVLLQEIRVRPEQLPKDFRLPENWHFLWNPAEKPGYSGTAIWSRFPIESWTTTLAPKTSDTEGRLISANICGLNLMSVYLPSGSSGSHRQEVKDRWLKEFAHWLKPMTSSGPVVFGGDLNVAHTEKDIFYAKSNEQTSGFLPHERAWFGRLLESGWHDLIREHHGDIQGPYSWWSNRGKARELDRGWRIDYLLCNAAARSMVRSAEIHRRGGIEVSDHAPVTIDVDSDTF